MNQKAKSFLSGWRLFTIGYGYSLFHIGFRYERISDMNWNEIFDKSGAIENAHFAGGIIVIIFFLKATLAAVTKAQEYN